MTVEIMDISKCLVEPSDNFDMLNYIAFSKMNSRSSTKNYFVHKYCRTWSRMSINFLPEMDITKSLQTIKLSLMQFAWSHFIANFNPVNHSTFHSCCLYPGVLAYFQSFAFYFCPEISD